LASVHHLPHIGPDAAPDPAAVALYTQLESQRGQRGARLDGYVTDAAALGRLTRTVATHHRTRAILGAAARHAIGYPIAGAMVLAQRVWDSRSGARYERMQRRAEQCGDNKALLEWESRAKDAREQRHRHRVEWWSTMPWAWTKAFGLGIGCVAGVLLVVGVALSVMSRDAAAIFAPFTAVFAFIADLVRIVTLVWASFLLVAVVAVWIVLWAVGRARATTPAWQAQENSDDNAPAARADATRRWTTSPPAITGPNEEGLTYYTDTGYEDQDPHDTATVVDAEGVDHDDTYTPADPAIVPAPRQPRRRLLPRPGLDPDEAAIIGSLQELGIPKLAAAREGREDREGWPAEDLDPGDQEYARRGLWPMRPTRDGDGWRCQIRLPRGVPVEMIVGKRVVLAHNLERKQQEVWATEPDDKASVLDLWIADRGSLNRPVPPYPLLANLNTVVTDYFRGVPVGIGIRANVINARLFEANYVLSGIMGGGKSTLILALLAGAMLDPLVDIHVFVMATNADYDPAEPRLATLKTGIGEDTVRACMDRIQTMYDNLEERGRALKEHGGERAATREIAEVDSRLRPQVLVIDECQALFLHAKYGKLAEERIVLLMSAARKYGDTIIMATPEPTNGGLPRQLVSVASNKACFSTGDHTSNDATLGTGSHRAGVTAVGLRPKTDLSLGDVGTAMTRGFTATPELLRFFYLSVEDLHRVTRRAVELYGGHGGNSSDGFREDVITVMGGRPKVKSSDVLTRLRTQWPSVYGGWSAQQLAQALRDGQVEIRAGRVDGEAGQRYVALSDMDGTDEHNARRGLNGEGSSRVQQNNTERGLTDGIA
jgi:hypothetical protein